MICATINTAPSSLSLRTLINNATPGQIPDSFSGRVSAIHLQWVDATAVITWLAGDLGNFATAFHRLQNDRTQLILRSPGGNQLSLDEIFIQGGGNLMRVLAFSV